MMEIKLDESTNTKVIIIGDKRYDYDTVMAAFYNKLGEPKEITETDLEDWY